MHSSEFLDVMDTIIQKNIFLTSGGELIGSGILRLLVPRPTTSTIRRKVRCQKRTAASWPPLLSYLKGKQCKAFPAPFGVWLDDENDNYVEPDITVICDQSKIHPKDCVGVNNILCESYRFAQQLITETEPPSRKASHSSQYH